MWRMSSPGTYSRCWTNSTENPRNGDLWSPTRRPSTIDRALIPSASARERTEGCRYVLGMDREAASGGQAANSLAAVLTRRLITSSTVTPSLWAVKLTISRCRRIGAVTATTSSPDTWFEPRRMAWALAARIRFMLARGPAPQVSHLLANSAASGVPGRDSRVIRLANWNTRSETGTRRTTFWSARMSSPCRTGETLAFTSEV